MHLKAVACPVAHVAACSTGGAQSAGVPSLLLAEGEHDREERTQPDLQEAQALLPHWGQVLAVDIVV